MVKIESAIKKHRDGVILDLFVKTNARKVVFPSGYNQWRKRIEIEVVSEPQENKANIEVIKTVAKRLSISTRDVFIIKGKNNKEKTLLLKDVFIDDIINKIRKSLDGL